MGEEGEEGKECAESSPTLLASRAEQRQWLIPTLLSILAQGAGPVLALLIALHKYQAVLVASKRSWPFISGI